MQMIVIAGFPLPLQTVVGFGIFVLGCIVLLSIKRTRKIGSGILFFSLCLIGGLFFVPDFASSVSSKPDLPWVGWIVSPNSQSVPSGEVRWGTQTIDMIPTIIIDPSSLLFVGMIDPSLVIVFDPINQDIVTVSGTTMWDSTTNSVSRGFFSRQSLAKSMDDAVITGALGTIMRAWFLEKYFPGQALWLRWMMYAKYWLAAHAGIVGYAEMRSDMQQAMMRAGDIPGTGDIQQLSASAETQFLAKRIRNDRLDQDDEDVVSRAGRLDGLRQTRLFQRFFE